MPYDPGTILIVGRKLREHFGYEKDISVAQMPLADYKGFRNLAGYLCRPERMGESGLAIAKEDLEYIWAVADAFREFPVKVKCEGEWGGCKKEAVILAVPYEKDCNCEEKKARGGPELVNQTDISKSLFCCNECSNELRHQRGGRVLELDISFRLPYSLIGPERREWNIDRKELHGKWKRIAYQLKSRTIDDVIDPRSLADERMRIDVYDAQKIASRLLSGLRRYKVREEDIPRERSGYGEPRKVELYTPKLQAPTWDDLRPLARKHEKKRRTRRRKEDPRQMLLALSD